MDDGVGVVLDSTFNAGLKGVDKILSANIAAVLSIAKMSIANVDYTYHRGALLHTYFRMGDKGNVRTRAVEVFENKILALRLSHPHPSFPLFQ